MNTDDIGKKDYEPWHPMTNPVDLKTTGKLIEELGECISATARCQIQGIDEVEPVTKYPNRLWLEDEIADVMLHIEITIERFGLDRNKIKHRMDKKRPLILSWHKDA